MRHAGWSLYWPLAAERGVWRLLLVIKTPDHMRHVISTGWSPSASRADWPLHLVVKAPSPDVTRHLYQVVAVGLSCGLAVTPSDQTPDPYATRHLYQVVAVGLSIAGALVVTVCQCVVVVWSRAGGSAVVVVVAHTHTTLVGVARRIVAPPARLHERSAPERDEPTETLAAARRASERRRARPVRDPRSGPSRFLARTSD